MPSLVGHVTLDPLLLLPVDASASQNHLEIWLSMLKQRGGHLSASAAGQAQGSRGLASALLA